MVARRMNPRNTEQKRIEDWMKNHTLHDMEDIVTELASEGEEVGDMAKVVHDLEVMVEEEEHWEQQQAVKARSEGHSSA